MEAPKYMFCRIPNDEEGKRELETIKKYLNRDRYSIRVKGQGLKDGEDWRRYPFGQPIDKSKFLRVYIEEKKNV
jgi:hypothetical protein